ncbi:MAG: HD domain-containing protein [Clostridiales bacterium]|uniref:bis(5'-nucleosyl)-tetraphosphatase (symmetrical) YqeK n=1 Tax=Clostridium sp. N3C TaxID=1776758 RepID=UPI00092E1F1D|nr:bis(5'-nucleosyl)-tetraphosphatase (symmetrical) YqeK [Clostridium sp. N3C]NLZ49634.1 HD domain-containing protein [Clostridiales bacterium]SCN21749.1 putative nicotinate-nucleotide adenylyltransferase [Clostridium sp. N3C]
MWKEAEIINYIQDKLSPKRYNHVLGVRDTAVKLARTYGENEEKASLAALLHDCAKNMEDLALIKLVKNNGYIPDKVEMQAPQLLHGRVAAIIAKYEMGIGDSSIYDAVTYHTTGRERMSLLEKIIYIADYIEPSRDFPGVEALREESFINLDKAMLMSLENTIKHIIDRGQLLHPNTVEARNYFLLQLSGGSSNE